VKEIFIGRGVRGRVGWKLLRREAGNLRLRVDFAMRSAGARRKKLMSRLGAIDANVLSGHLRSTAGLRLEEDK
jgi:hypothetical protein